MNTYSISGSLCLGCAAHNFVVFEATTGAFNEMILHTIIRTMYRVWHKIYWGDLGVWSLLICWWPNPMKVKQICHCFLRIVKVSWLVSNMYIIPSVIGSMIPVHCSIFEWMKCFYASSVHCPNPFPSKRRLAHSKWSCTN